MKKLIWNCFLWITKNTGYWGIKLYHRVQYRTVRDRWPNFENPKDLSEYILSSMQKPSFLKYADLADKVKVYDYIKSKGLEDILLKHYGTWPDANSIDFDKLPQKFILKPNNGSGGHIICKDKKSLNKEYVRKFLNENLQRGCEYYFEPHYRKITPLILCEELMDTGTDKSPVDYKFTCIKGEIVDIFVVCERETNAKYCTLNENWEMLNYTRQEFLPERIPAKPIHLKDMLKYAEILCQDFEFVRVDLYEYNDKVYFSELTFSPWGGYMYSYTEEALKILGDKFKRN